MAIPGSVVLLGALGAAAALAWIYVRDLGVRRSQRGRLFSACLELFQACRVVQDGPGYPVLTGRYQGVEVKLEPVVDHIAWRKVPSLWLKATVLAPGAPGVLDMIVRPQGVEFYSPSGDLEHRMSPPPGFPADALICTDDEAALPLIEKIRPHLAMFEDPRMKELLITPRGVRLVRQLWQADRARYAVLRQAEFPAEALSPDLARSLLDAAMAIWTSVRAPEPAPLLKAS